MNIENTKKCIEVMQAFVDGKEANYQGSSGSPCWNWHNDPGTYFIKPEPQAFELEENQYLAVYGKSGKQLIITGPCKFIEVLK